MNVNRVPVFRFNSPASEARLITGLLRLCGGFGEESVNGSKQRFLIALRQVINLLNATQQAAVGRRAWL
jgi:hypothetical protein